MYVAYVRGWPHPAFIHPFPAPRYVCRCLRLPHLRRLLPQRWIYIAVYTLRLLRGCGCGLPCVLVYVCSTCPRFVTTTPHVPRYRLPLYLFTSDLHCCPGRYSAVDYVVCAFYAVTDLPDGVLRTHDVHATYIHHTHYIHILTPTPHLTHTRSQRLHCGCYRYPRLPILTFGWTLLQLLVDYLLYPFDSPPSTDVPGSHT